MPGFSNETGDESIMFADNVSFDGTERGGKISSDGQILIGSSSSPHIQVGTISSSSGTLQITNGAGSINVELTPTTQYNVQVGSASGGLADVAPSVALGVPLVSQGIGSNPSFTTAQVVGGGTGKSSLTAYAPLCGGTAATNPVQSVASVGTSGQVLTSNGAGALPTFQDASGGGMPYADFYWKASDFDALETNFGALAQDNGTTVKAFVRAFDDTTQEYVNFSFQAPTDLDTTGTVTFRVNMYAASAAADKFVSLDFDHRAISDSEAIDSSYTTEASGDIAIDSTQDDITIATWTETVSNLAWAANDFVICRLSRTTPSGTNLTGDLYVLGFEVSIPRA